MASATKPPMIAPGILCPKCKGPMLDERTSKRTDKSPDFTCANMTCVQTGANGKSYRTAIWAEKSSGAENGSAGGNQGPAGTMASVPSARSAIIQTGTTTPTTVAEVAERPKLTKLYLDATEFVLGSVVPLYEKAKIGCSDQAVAAMVATLYISATKER